MILIGRGPACMQNSRQRVWQVAAHQIYQHRRCKTRTGGRPENATGLFNLNSEVEVWDTASNNVGQAFQPAGLPDFPVRPWGDWKVAPTGREERLPYANSPAASLADFGFQV
jgi:hypothetical protein